MNYKDQQLLEELFWDDKVPAAMEILTNKEYAAINGEDYEGVKQQLVYEYLYEVE